MKIKYGHIIEDELKYRWKNKAGLNSCSFTGIVSDISHSISGWIFSIVCKEKMSGGGNRDEIVKCFSPEPINLMKGAMVFVSGKKRGDVIEVRELEVLA